MANMQNLIDRIRAGRVTTEELRCLTQHPAALVRVNAIEMLAQKGNGDEQLLDDLRIAAVAAVNQVCLMGTVRVGHVAIGSLLRIGSARALTIANDLIESRTEPERTDLLSYLHSEGFAPIGIK